MQESVIYALFFDNLDFELGKIEPNNQKGLFLEVIIQILKYYRVSINTKYFQT